MTVAKDSQIALEVFAPGSPKARVSQLTIELLYPVKTTGTVSQIVVEVLAPPGFPVGGETLGCVVC